MEPKRYVYLQSHTLVQTVGELNPLSTIPLPPCDIDRKSSVPGHTATHQHCSKQPMALSHKQQEQQQQRRPQQQHSAKTAVWGARKKSSQLEDSWVARHAMPAGIEQPPNDCPPCEPRSRSGKTMGRRCCHA